jgi:ketosteroid isomerase-like protein
LNIDDVIAEAEIRNVIARYAVGVDQFDWDLVRSCYHSDAIDVHMTYTGGVDGFIDLIRASEGRYVMAAHQMGLPYIRIDGSKAHVETYCTATHVLRRDDRGPERVWIMWVRYEDRFEKRDGEWRIAHRTLHCDGDITTPVSDTRIPHRPIAR